MNSPPLINYDLLYSPEPKKENFKLKQSCQTSATASTSLSNPLKETKTFNFLKSPNSNAKPVFPSDFTSKPINIANTHTFSIVPINNFIEKPKIPEIKPPINIPEKVVNTNLECFKVFARIRPLNSREITCLGQNKKTNFVKSIVRLDETSVKLYPIEYQINIGKEEKIFSFDQVFDENDNNESIFRKTMLSPVENLLNGYNSTILAYGMTGTGKTHTMFGDIYCLSEAKEPEPGLIILTVKDIFWKIEIQINENRNLEFKIKLSYLEIYNEQVKDLLVDNSENLMILEDQYKGVVIPDLTEIQLNNPSEIMKLIDQGNDRRTMASTSSNQFSSRSHAILILSIEKRNLLEPSQIIYAKFCLVDLAGSERALISDVKGIRMTEGANINKSLLALGNCINILSDSNKKGAFVPYRDSKLTRLLKESLGGNTKTIMIACLSPSNLSYEETLNTLKYASRAKNIKRKVNKNIREIEDVTEYKGIIETLKNEIDNLKEQLMQKNKASLASGISEEEGMMTLSKKNDMKGSVNGVDLGEKIEGISQKIMSNLEENWEIKQSVLELKNLQASNQINLQEKKRRLDVLKHENPIFINWDPNSALFNTSSMGPNTRRNLETETLERDILALEENMNNNAKILNQMESHMVKTREKRDRLHDDMLKIHENNNQKLVNDLKTACDILNKEKMDLQTKNFEMKRKEEDLVKLQEQKDSTIKEMQKTIEFMKKKLDEKDKIIEENNLIIKNLSNNNLDLIKSSLAKHKNYRSNTAENKINVKFQEKQFNSNTKRADGKIEDFPKNTSGIRQYFKGKSAGNFQTNYKSYQKSKDFQSASFSFFFKTKLNLMKKLLENNVDNEAGGINSNRSNFDSKGLKKNLDKLSECSSLTRFEAGNNDAYKNSLLLPTDDNSPIPLHKNNNIKNEVEMFEDIECTKKIVENLSEVSSILQEESQNFSVSDQIMFENLDRNCQKADKSEQNFQNLKGNYYQTSHQEQITKGYNPQNEQINKGNTIQSRKNSENPHLIEDYNQIFTQLIPKEQLQNFPINQGPTQNFKKKNNEKEENNKELTNMNKDYVQPSFAMNHNVFEDEDRNEVRNNKMFENPFKSMNSNSQSTLFPSHEYRLYNFKDRIQKAFAQLRQVKADRNKDATQLQKEILDMILENNKTPFVLDDYHHTMFQECKDFYYANVPKGSELSRSFLEKNRSNSANGATERKDNNSSKGNIKLFTNKAVNLPSNGSFIRTYTEKGFYENLDKNKNKEKTKSQPFHYIKYGSINLQDPVNLNLQEKNFGSGTQSKNDPINIYKTDERNVVQIPWDELTKKDRDTKESQEVKSLIEKQREHLREEYMKLEEQKHNMYVTSPAGKLYVHTPSNFYESDKNLRGVSSPLNFKTKIKADTEFSDNYSKFSNKK